MSTIAFMMFLAELGSGLAGTSAMILASIAWVCLMLRRRSS
ncbi:MAG: hypothetical protein ACON39_03975 [Coraliomargaritaceae bacterium]